MKGLETPSETFGTVLQTPSREARLRSYRFDADSYGENL